MKTTTILLLSGSTRTGSTNSAALRTIDKLAPPTLQTILYGGLVDLPAFIPDIDDAETPATVVELRRQIDGADALLISTPEYAGTLPGSLKNLIDWTIPTGDLYHKPVAWLNVAAPGRGAGVIDTLKIVLGFATAEIIEPACHSVFIGRQALGADGLVADPESRAALLDVLMRIAEHLQSRQA